MNDLQRKTMKKYTVYVLEIAKGQNYLTPANSFNNFEDAKKHALYLRDGGDLSGEIYDNESESALGIFSF